MNTLHRVLLAGAVTALAVSTPVSAEPFSGFWDTNQGPMRIHQEEGSARGDYELKGGRIHADVDFHTMTGIWAQDSSGRRCHEKRMGTHYWGRFRLHLADSEDFFHGRWSYCEDEEGSGGEWTGRRVREHHWHHWDEY